MTAGLKGVTISVNYGDLLAITLPRNAHYFSEIVVGTTPDDKETQEVVAKVPNARCHLSTSFFNDGAVFNKGLVVEECLDEIGRSGWMLIHDADTLFPSFLGAWLWVGMGNKPPHGKPSQFKSIRLNPEKLYNPHRRCLRDPSQWREDLNWKTLPLLSDKDEFPGFFQLFHASAKVLKSRPWYTTSWRHAGGCDSEFQARWPSHLKERLKFEVLHLGEDGQNWHGRTTKRADGSLPIHRDENQAKQDAMFQLRKQTDGKSRFNEERLK